MTEVPKLPAGCASRFVPRRVLASGGFGSVVLAQQVDLDRAVAIKLLHSDISTDPEQVERFCAEARITAALTHPHIVRVLDHGFDDGVPWIAYEFLAGVSLSVLLEAGPLATGEALAAAGQVASALEVAHQSGILHRDVKPANVMEAGPGIYKVTDFGIARWTTGAAVRTKTGVILGTPAYMAPELVQGERASVASDVYALGVMIYELVTGQLPFSGASYLDVLRKHLSEEAPPPSQLRPGLPTAVDLLIRRALAKDPAVRYPSADAMRIAVEAIDVKSVRRAVTGGGAGW